MLKLLNLNMEVSGLQNQFEVTLKPSQHKRRITKHVLITSDDAGSSTKMISYNPTALLIVIIAMSIVIGSLIGVIFFERQQIALGNDTISDRDAEIAGLNADVNALNGEIDSLNNKVRYLSDTVETKTANEEALTMILEEQWIPNDFPLTGSARLIDSSDAEDPMIVLNSSDGSSVIATAYGVVENIVDDDEFGNMVIIDHGNGYKTYYRNRGQVMVNKGDDVVSGTTIYIISSDNESLCYQISNNGVYIDPTDIIDING